MSRYIYYKTEKDLQKTMQFSTAIKYNSKNISVIIRQIEKKALAALLTLFYMGFWRYVNKWGGGVKTIPPIKIRQNDSNLVERHVLAKID